MTIDDEIAAPRCGGIGAPAARSLALLLGFDFVDLSSVELESSISREIPESFAREACLVPLGMRSAKPTYAVGVPADAASLERIRSTFGEDVRLLAAPRDQVERVLDELYGPAPGEIVCFSTGTSATRDKEHLEQGDERRTLESILCADGLLSANQMALALQEQRETGKGLAEIVASRHWISEGELLSALAEESGLDLVDLDDWEIDPAVVRLIPESLSRLHRVVCVGLDDGLPIVAISDPSDVLAIDDVRTLLGRDTAIVICLASQIDALLDRTYDHTADVAAKSAALSHAATGLATTVISPSDVHNDPEDAPIVQFVNAVLRQALSERASDVHIEPTASDLSVRFRIDGVLHEVTSAPKAIERGVTTRLKVMANVDIAEHRLPQDGRITIAVGEREIDMRVATLPTVHGEKVVLRILDRSTAPLELDKLGFLPDVRARYAAAYAKPSGTILITGPTGSGKSTTLYATLNELNSPERNLVTVEDPAEYQLKGINQVQVNPRAGLHFANALRAILRSDPDVLLVGEIRDRETATIAVEAALTGHLVLSCLHTSDAVTTPLRLIEMGVEPFLVSSSLDCVLAQRLARVLCPLCAESYSPPLAELLAAGFSDEVASLVGEPLFRRPIGCRACGQTGYRGRVAIQEVMLVTEDLERAVLSRAHNDELRRIAIEEGMRPLQFDGLRKAATGATSLEEILRVIT